MREADFWCRGPDLAMRIGRHTSEGFRRFRAPRALKALTLAEDAGRFPGHLFGVGLP